MNTFLLLVSINSYIESNCKMDNQCWHYSKKPPSFLVNRPRDLITHYCNGMEDERSEDLYGISLVEKGVFSVVSFMSDAMEVYVTTFGGDDTMPNCTCPQWETSAYPCTHFFAVFREFSDWQWDALSPLQLAISDFRCSRAS